jgi:hypothetical protein
MSEWHLPSISSRLWGPASSSVRFRDRTKVQPGSAWLTQADHPKRRSVPRSATIGGNQSIGPSEVSKERIG